MVVIRTSTRRKIVDQRIIFTFRFIGEGFGTVENCMVIRNSHLGLNYLDVSRFKNYYYSLQDFLYDMEFDSTTEQLVRFFCDDLNLGIVSLDKINDEDVRDYNNDLMYQFDFRSSGDLGCIFNYSDRVFNDVIDDGFISYFDVEIRSDDSSRFYMNIFSRDYIFDGLQDDEMVEFRFSGLLDDTGDLKFKDYWCTDEETIKDFRLFDEETKRKHIGSYTGQDVFSELLRVLKSGCHLFYTVEDDEKKYYRMLY